MYLCVICRFAVELDDAVVPTSSGTCVCIRCFVRQTENDIKPMDKDLKLSIEALLADLEPAQQRGRQQW
jgi:hypothetical protein